MTSQQLLRRFTRFLCVWGALEIAFWCYLNIRWDRGKHLPGWHNDLAHYLNLTHPYYWGLLYATFIIVPAVLFHRGAAAQFGGFRSYIGRAIWLLTIGAVVWGMGNAVWFYYNVRGTEAPYPSLADLGYVSILPFAAAALYYLTKALAVRPRDLLRAAWIPFVMLLITGYFVFPSVEWLSFGSFHYGKSSLYTSDSTFMEIFVASLYLSVDVVLMSLAIVLANTARQTAGALLFRPLATVVASILMLYVADMFFFARVANDTYYAADMSEGLYGVFIFLVSLSVCNFLRAAVQSQSPAGRV